MDNAHPIVRALRPAWTAAWLSPGSPSGGSGPGASPPARALAWIRAQEAPAGGIMVHPCHSRAYPEVSGYLVPTLLAYGERRLAARIVRWLIAIQRGDGSFTGPDDGLPYVFDTGQALRGLLAGIDLSPEAPAAAERAARYLIERMVEGGRGGFGDQYRGAIPEPIHLYVLPPLLAAAEHFERSEWHQPVRDCLEHYAAHPEALRLEHLTHFLAYELEALIELGREDLARPPLRALEEAQAEDGSVPARAGERWVCTPGLAQIAICWYRTAQPEAADRAMDWIEKHQEKGGGFRGSHGRRASYFPDSEPAWAAKFYLDAHLHRTRWFFERNAESFPGSVAAEDGRSSELLAVVRPCDRVLEVGCGKGRFLRMLMASVADLECAGVDFSPAMLREAPPEARRLTGSLESIPAPDDRYDVVFSVEAIEHSPNPEAAVAEMIRVARPGGWVVVIDKQASEWGRMDCPPWERWPEADGLMQLLGRGCDSVSSGPVGYDGHPADGLMVAWRGRKRFSPGVGDAGRVEGPTISSAWLLERLRCGQFSPWCQEVLLATAPGERVLEVSSGTGEIALALALGGRRVAVLEPGRERLQVIRDCAVELGVSIDAILGDAAARFSSFADGEFDCVFSSGLLEHYLPEARRAILRECARVSRGRVLALVPNASCIAYRLGKEFQEARGQWIYGLEIPLHSLREDFAAAGLRVSSECSVGGRHALGFLPPGHPLRESMETWIDGRSEDELREWNQGYLVFTRGEKAGPAPEVRPA